ncbi:protein undicht [Haemaphysalis longicornis]
MAPPSECKRRGGGCLLNIFELILLVCTLPVGHGYYGPRGRCSIPQTLQGEWYSKEAGDDTYTTIDDNRMSNRGNCLHLVNRNNDNFTIIFENNDCYYCVRIFVRTLNVLEKIETGCVNLNDNEMPDIKTVCRTLDVNQELITLFSMEPVSIKCPVAGKFRFDQSGDIPFETRIRGGVTQIPRPNVYCKENISDFSVCDKDQKIILIDANYCISVDYYGRPVDIYSEPDYELKCIAFWKENLRSYLITYNKEDAYSKYRCWVYQRADLNRVLMSQSVGAFCHVLQDVTSNNYTQGAEVALDMVEYEREHDDCPMYFDDGSNPYQQIAEQAAILMGSAPALACHVGIVQLLLLACLRLLL